MARAICVLGVPEIRTAMFPDAPRVIHVAHRNDLQHALSALPDASLVIDLDGPDALLTIATVLENHAHAPIVGVTAGKDLNLVINAQRAGCRQITTRPIDANDLISAIRRAISISGDVPEERHTYAVMGATGGAGATALACNLALEYAAQRQQNVAVVDLDLEFGGVARAFDVAPPFSIADLASVGAPDSTMLEKTLVALPSGVHLCASPPTIQDAHAVDEHATRAILKLVSQVYAGTIIDLPRKLDAITGAAIEVADRLLLVLQLTVPSIANARRLLDALSSEGLPPERVELVVNRYRRNTHACTLDMVVEQTGRPVIATIPSDYAAVAGAGDHGKPLPSKNPVRTAIAGLCSRLTGIAAPTETSRSWLNLFKPKTEAAGTA